MIAILAQTFNVVALFVQQLFQIASFVGQVIVILLTTFINFIFRSFKSALIFFQIVYEDNVFIFTEELPNWTVQYFETMHTQYSYVQNCLWQFYSEVHFKIISIVSSVYYTIDTLFVVVYEILLLFKQILLLLGNSLWLILTFLPIHLPYLLKTITIYTQELVGNIALDAYKVLLKFTNFLSDVPLESFVGIMTAIAILRFYISFRLEIQSEVLNMYWIIVRKLWYLYHSVYSYFTNSDVRMIARIANGEAIMTRDVNFDDMVEDTSAADALCVICQERQKCVLILPCKHVCLCRECCHRLYGYQRTCPICRTFIYHSVTIYL